MNFNTKEIKPHVCFVCDKPRQNELGGQYLLLQNKRVYFCADHAEAFACGHNIGRATLHSTLVDFFADMNDNARGWELKKKVYELIPHAKIQLLENKRVFALADKSPKVLYDALDKVVVGQNLAKTQISLAVYKHLQSLKAQTVSTAPDKHNILLLGPSGCGKTLIAHTIAQELELPFVSSDATGLSPAGYSGGDADNLVAELLEQSNNIVEIAQRGTIFLDEIDKLATSQAVQDKEQHSASTQSTLLRLIEGKVVKTPSAQQAMLNQMPQQNVDTSKVLWFFGGAFPGLAAIVGKKMGYSGKKMGFINQNFGSKSEKEMEDAIQNYEILSSAPIQLLVESLIEYGITAEFIGRIPTISPLAPLNRAELMKCLCEIEHSPVQKQQKLFAACGYDLLFEQDVLDTIVDSAFKMATGTRALNILVNQSVMQASFELLGPASSSNKGRVIITKLCLEDSSKYIFEKKKTRRNTASTPLVAKFSS